MKTEKNLFGEDVPSKKIKSWKVRIPDTLVAQLQDKAARIESEETKHSSGGYQSWVDDTLLRLKDYWLDVDYLYIGRTFRYAYTPSGGGWERICNYVLDHIRHNFSFGDKEWPQS